MQSAPKEDRICLLLPVHIAPNPKMKTVDPPDICYYGNPTGNCKESPKLCLFQGAESIRPGCVALGSLVWLF